MWQKILEALSNFNWIPVIAALVIFILLIVGGILLKNGFRNKNNKCSFLGGGLVTVAFLAAIVESIPDFGSALLAFATLILAIFTGFLVIENRALREQDRKKDETDRKERLLNEIMEWTLDVLSLDSRLFRLTESIRLDISVPNNITVDLLHSDSLNLRDRGKYILEVSKTVNDKIHRSLIKLNKAITKIESLFNTFEILSELDSPPTDKITTENADYTITDDGKDTIEGYRKVLSSLTDTIIKEVTKEKLKTVT